LDTFLSAIYLVSYIFMSRSSLVKSWVANILLAPENNTE